MSVLAQNIRFKEKPLCLVSLLAYSEERINCSTNGANFTEKRREIIDRCHKHKISYNRRNYRLEELLSKKIEKTLPYYYAQYIVSCEPDSPRQPAVTVFDLERQNCVSQLCTRKIKLQTKTMSYIILRI